MFRPEPCPDAARPAGAILVSGPYTFDFAAAGRGELAYFGEDPSRWPDMVVPGNVTSAAVPALMTTAEWDNARYTTSYALLFHELVTKHGVVPRYLQSWGTIIRRSCYRSAPVTTAFPASSSTSSSARAAADARGCTIRAWACSSVG